MRKGKNELNDMMPFDANDNETTDFDGKNFKLSIHMSGGVFKRKLGGVPPQIVYLNLY